jgi:flagellar hook-length control protein FliK
MASTSAILGPTVQPITAGTPLVPTAPAAQTASPTPAAQTATSGTSPFQTVLNSVGQAQQAGPTSGTSGPRPVGIPAADANADNTNAAIATGNPFAGLIAFNRQFLAIPANAALAQGDGGPAGTASRPGVATAVGTPAPPADAATRARADALGLDRTGAGLLARGAAPQTNSTAAQAAQPAAAAATPAAPAAAQPNADQPPNAAPNGSDTPTGIAGAVATANSLTGGTPSIPAQSPLVSILNPVAPTPTDPSVATPPVTEPLATVPASALPAAQLGDRPGTAGERFAALAFAGAQLVQPTPAQPGAFAAVAADGGSAAGAATRAPTVDPATPPNVSVANAAVGNATNAPPVSAPGAFLSVTGERFAAPAAAGTRLVQPTPPQPGVFAAVTVDSTGAPTSPTAANAAAAANPTTTPPVSAPGATSNAPPAAPTGAFLSATAAGTHNARAGTPEPVAAAAAAAAPKPAAAQTSEVAPPDGSVAPGAPAVSPLNLGARALTASGLGPVRSTDGAPDERSADSTPSDAAALAGAAALAPPPFTQTPAAGETTAPAATPAAQVADAVVGHTQVLAKNGTVEFHMRLDPPDLGRVQIQLVARGDEVHGQVLVASEAVRQTMESQLPELRQRLEAAGVNVQQFSVATDPGTGGGRNPYRDSAPPEYAAPAPSSTAAGPVRQPVGRRTGSLDVTV